MMESLFGEYWRPALFGIIGSMIAGVIAMIFADQIPKAKDDSNAAKHARSYRFIVAASDVLGLTFLIAAVYVYGTGLVP